MSGEAQAAASRPGLAAPAWEGRLRAAARALVLALPLCYLAGRVPTDAALSLVALLFLARSALLRDWAWLGEGWVRLGLLLWAWMLLASALAVDQALAFQQSAFWWRFPVFGAALAYWVLDEALVRRLALLGAAVLALVAADTWLQLLTGADLLGKPPANPQRMTGPFDDPRVGTWSMRLLLPVAFALLGLALGPARRRAGAAWWLAWLLPVAGAVVVSGERMATAQTLGGLALGAWLLRGPARRLVGAGVALALAAGVGLAAWQPQLVDRFVQQTRSTLAGLAREGLAERGYGQIWLSALHLARERPWTGVGPKNFRVACADPALGLPARYDGRCTTHPHNLYLEWLVGTGVPGLLLFLGLIGAWLLRLWPALGAGPSPWLAGCAAALAAQLWPLGPTGSFFSNWYGGAFYLALGGALWAARRGPGGHVGQGAQEARSSRGS